VLGAGALNHYDQVHVLLWIEQAGINIILGTPEFEHGHTFGDKRQ
jgi:hypothetical protein